MESLEQLRKIAIYCDEYRSNLGEKNNLRSSSQEESFESCTNCNNYSRGKCELDLIDKVLSSLSMDLDLK